MYLSSGLLMQFFSNCVLTAPFTLLKLARLISMEKDNVKCKKTAEGGNNEEVPFFSELAVPRRGLQRET